MGGSCSNINFDYVNLEDKVAVVTGANTGIGKETALALAKLGAHVVIACRSSSRGGAAEAELQVRLRDETGRGSVKFMQLDLSDFSSVRSFAASLKAEYKQLDILVNNAGLNTINSQGGRTANGFEMCFGVNYLGHYLLTRHLLPHLEKSPEGGRVVNLSSVMHESGDPAKFAEGLYTDLEHSYGNSKLAMNLLTLELEKRKGQQGQQQQQQQQGVKAVSVNPGAVNSDIWRTLPNNIIGSAAKFIFKLIFLEPAQGAATSIHAAVGPDIKGGEYLCPYKDWWGLSVFKIVAPFAGSIVSQAAPAAHDHEAAGDLWALSEKLVEDFL